MTAAEIVKSGGKAPFSFKYTLYILEQHSADRDEFLDTFGFHDTYSAAKVLEWLGY